ncbi:MAG: glycosyltransferase, partial [Alphaproteobacteria bacterium]
MQRPSILFINRVYPPARGASGRILYDLVHRFAQEGWDVHVLTTGRISQSETSENVHVKYIKGVERPRFDVYYLWIWLKLLVVAFMMPKTHIVVTMTDPPMTSLIGRLMARFSGMKHIHWCQDLYPDILPAIGVKLPPFMRKSLTSLSRRTMQNADKTIVIGRCMARHLSYTGLDPKKITVIPNWPVSELTDPVHHDTEFYTYIQNLQESAGSKA